jgi:hypothetical protein
MKSLAAAAGALAFAIVSTHAVAAVVAPKVPTPQVKLTVPKANVPKVNSNQNKSFEVKDFSFGVENPTTVGSATGGAGAGKITFNPFSVTKPATVCRHCPNLVGPNRLPTK